jgi:hypothetical protein
MLREISFVVAVCSSTAAAIVDIMELISVITATISFMASTADEVLV